jgi:hypothetical protein
MNAVVNGNLAEIGACVVAMTVGEGRSLTS